MGMPSMTPPDGPPGLAAAGEVDRDERGDPEEGAVGQAGQQPGPDEQAVVRRDGRQQVADGEGHHEPDEQGLARPGGAPARRAAAHR
jgi:hypothetical protein